MPKMTINPVNTGNQPLLVEFDLEGNRVTDARVGIRGLWDLERMLIGKHPFDSLQVALRMNSHLAVSHGLAAAKVLEQASGVKLAFNGMLGRNILLAAEYLYYHVYHFYQGMLFTFIENSQTGVTNSGPSRVPGNIYGVLKGNYWRAIQIRTRLQEMMAVFSGKAPHNISIVPGGLSEIIEARKIIKISACLKEVEAFLKDCYVEDVRTLVQFFPEWARMPLGKDNYIVADAFPQKVLKTGLEDEYLIKAALQTGGNQKTFSTDKVELDDIFCWKNSSGELDLGKASAYSWGSAGRVEETPVESGIIARSALTGLRAEIDTVVERSSVLGREMTRVAECLEFVEQIKLWTEYLDPAKPLNGYEGVVPEEGSFTSAVESAAGPVIHKVAFEKGLIEDYKIIDPLVFNYSPKDRSGERGPIEEALEGLVLTDPNNPVEVLRIVRSME